MRKILWIASWYPNRMDKYIGDFVERQAVAVGMETTVIVMHVIRDKDLPAGELKIEFDQKNNTN